MADSDAAFAPEPSATGWSLPRAGGVDVHLDGRGATVRVGGREARLEARSIRRGAGRSTPLASGEPSVSGNEVRIDRGGATTEWWRSLPRGIEHGFTVGERPAGDGEVAIEFEVRGGMRPDLRGDGVVLVDGGDVIAHYDDLVVVDSAGHVLASRIEVVGSRVRLDFEDRDARYPVVVDPMISGEEQKLLASDKADFDIFGYSVAMSADGSRVVVGAPYEDDATGTSTTDNGAAYVFVRSGTTWTWERKLLASDKATDDNFGWSVAISADGSRIVVGAVLEDDATGTSTTDNGAAYIFVRSGTAWFEERKLLASDRASSDHFGASVAVSADGSRVIVGADRESEPTGTVTNVNGAAYVFVRSGAAWSEERKLLASDKASSDFFGRSVAMSADGSRVVVGAISEDDATGTSTTDNGAAYVFVRSGTTWTQERKLLASDKATGDLFGASVAMSTDGSRIVVGAVLEDDATGTSTTGNGAAYVFVRSGTTWTQERKLLASDKATDDDFGWSVAISADGSRVVVGAYTEDQAGASVLGNGAAYVFVRSGTTWTEERKLLASDWAPGDLFGASVAICEDGSRIVVGSRADDDATSTSTDGNGAAYVFLFGGNGTSCQTDADCVSAHCVDQVCCNTACGGGAPNDCEACVASLTGLADGTCGPLSPAVAPTMTCNASTGVCDPAESCVAGVTTCPADRLHDPAYVCRPNAPGSTCDVPETCNGLTAACPSDGFASATVQCRSSAGLCDAAEFCTGSSALCHDDALIGNGVECRPSAGVCDAAERCDGSTAQCPNEAYSAPGTPCRIAVPGGCDIAEVCSGSSAQCPPDSPAANGTPCDDGLNCTGSSACQSGTCAPALTLDCSDGDSCTEDACSEPIGCTHTMVAACFIDAGFDAGGDGGTPPVVMSSSCGCRVASAEAPGSAALALSVLAAYAFGRRSARPRRRRL